MTNEERLEQLIAGRYPCVVAVTQEENYVLSLLVGIILRQPLDMKIWSVVGGLRDGVVADQPPTPETEHPAGALFYALRHQERAIYVFIDLLGHLGDRRVNRLLRELIAKCRGTGSTVVLLDHSDDVPPVISADSIRFDVALPSEGELESMIRRTLQRLNVEQHIDVQITERQFSTMIRNLRGLTRAQAEQVVIETVAVDRCFNSDDLNTVIARKRQVLHNEGLLEYVEAPVDMAQIAGMKRLKRWLGLRANSSTDKARAFGIDAPRGILLLGVQGAGKSYCAKAIATAWQRPLLSMDVGRLYDRYIGESERRLRDALHQAEMISPIVLWIDEIEKCFASAASRSTDGGLSQRMFGSLLTWMQEHRAPVFLVATANDIEALPPELLRKGRFDEIFFVDLPDESTRAEILAVHLKKRARDPAPFDLPALATASDGFSGAELEQAIIAAMHEAFAQNKELSTEFVLSAIAESPPLSMTMAEKVAALRTWAVNRCVPAD